ncbi:MAG: hypothetical protein AW10_01845 [Candidatus Accumulibacter appositus]|uniref:Uncharacterized protein n=1 Tax=Candidatus Accumulibacter appositus TaxID=1454003 RepID=A0A011QN98_9PROT|nr:MAG: hypothetical protein AW10_01845 [Candidatus Accumulibacter appositus]
MAVVCAGGVGQLQQQQVLAEATVANQLDIAVDLLHRVPVVLGEICCDAHQPGSSPVDAVGGWLAQLAHCQQLELGLVVHQPVEVEQALIDDVFAYRALVFENHWAIVLVQAQGVDAAGVCLAGGVFGRQKADAKQRLQVGLDQRLQWTFEIRGVALQLGGLARLEVEEFDVAHCWSPSG